MSDSFNGYYLVGYGNFTLHQLPAGLPLLTTALVGLILGVIVWTVRSEQGDDLALGEVTKRYFG